jgi:ketopantoate reductase
VTRNREHTDLGLFPNSRLDKELEQNRMELYTAILKDGGHSVSLEKNIQIRKWEKVVCNILWNPISALTRQNMGVNFFESSNEAESFGKALMLDVIAVARASGVPLDDKLADKYIAFTKSLGSFQPSMLHDLNGGIPLEIDVIIGAPMKMAIQLGMEVPSLRAVYALISALNKN